MEEFKLHKYPKLQTGFKIPENYFDTLPDKISIKILSPEIDVIKIQNSKFGWTYAAAAVTIISLIIPALNNYPKKIETEQSTIENFISYHTDISSDDLVDLLEPEDIEKININYNIEDNAIEDLLSTNSNLENYIFN